MQRIGSVLKEPGHTLPQRVGRSGIWVFISQIANGGFGLIRTIILARLLVPSDFGLVGIAAISASLLEVFSQTGFRTALVQRKEEIRDYLDTAWVVSVIRGFALFGILFMSAPLISQFFDNPRATLVVQVMAISLALKGLTNIGTVYFTKELEFKKEVLLQLSGTIASLAISIPLAFMLKNVWAIVFGSLAGSFTGVVLSYVVHPYRPKVRFNATQAKSLFGFGRYVLASGVLIFLLTQGDDAFVGRMLGTASLGLYALAYKISNMPSTQITHVVSQVTFPAYSKLQDNVPKLREAYLRTLQLTASISIPLAVGIFALAPEFTRAFLGEKWLPMVPAMQTLCIFGATRSIGATMGPILYGVGKPRIQTRLSTIQLIAMAVLIYPLTMKWGILGAALAVVLPNALALVLITKETKSIVGFSYASFGRLLSLPLGCAAVVGVALYAMKHLVWFGESTLGLLTLIFLGLALYLGAVYLLDRRLNYGLRDTVMNKLLKAT